MADISPLDALQALHRELVAVCEHRFESLHILEQELNAHAQAFKKLLDKRPRSNGSRDAVKTGKITVDDDEYSINPEFQEIALQLADELDLDEVESAKLLLDSQDDLRTLGRPLLECGVIRFHQQRKYLLDCMRLCIQIGADDELESNLQDVFSAYVTENIYGATLPGERSTTDANGGTNIVSRCMQAMKDIKNWLQKLSDRMTTANVVYADTAPRLPIHEVVEFSRISLIQQHELLSLIMASAVEKRHAKAADFQHLLKVLQKFDRYDQLLVHFFPIVGNYITVFGSTEGNGDLQQARELHTLICGQTDNDTWVLPYFHAAVQAWWIIEYSGWFVDSTDGDSKEEEKGRGKIFTDALKDGAFDFILAVAADVKTPEWQDPARLGIRQWLQRNSPSLPEAAQFSEHFQTTLMVQLEMLVEGLISNLPDVLRKLRSEEDEQRQLSQSHEQDLDLERFLLIIAYAYEGRPDAADAFWVDPDSNLAGFLQWASRRASTPLVSAFCEMLQSISDNENCASSAHDFLLDESQLASGKMRKTLSLTWSQIFKELSYFTGKLRERPVPSQSYLWRSGKPTPEQAEAEPESEMMLECYLRLITKLSSQSETVRMYLLTGEFNLAQALFQLAGIPAIPPRLRSCAFYALRAFMSRKSWEECSIMWKMLDAWATGQHQASQIQARQQVAPINQTPASLMRKQLQDLARGFEEPNAIVQFLNSLVSPVEEESLLNDVLAFPEDLGSQARMPGIDPYVDYVLGYVFGENSGKLRDVTQMRMLRLSCLEFSLLCLNTFNEDLIVIGNETNIPVDSIIATTDLAAYVRLHPFARVMEWMLNDRVMDALFETINQRHPDDVTLAASATPDSPIILSILRAVEVATKVLEMQDTYADLIRPLVRSQSQHKKDPVARAAYSSFEDGIMNHLSLVVKLGRYCGMGHPALTLACLKLLEKVSSSSRIASAWNPGHFGQTHRNKAIVALEENGDAESISGCFVAELTEPLDLARGADSPNHMIKVFILDFLFACLQATPDQPTIAHLLLGFQCGIDTVSVEVDGDFDSRASLFHNMLRVLLEAPYGDDEMGVWRWTIELKFKIMRILRILWTSPLSSSIVLNELRDNDFLFHLLLREITIQPSLPWDGQILGGPEFLLTDASITFASFLALRAITFEYASIELCSVSQSRLPHFKRRLLDALNGQLKGDDGELVPVSSIFDLFDFLPPDGQQWDVPPPPFQYYRDLDLRPCLVEDADLNTIYNIERVREMLILKRNEFRSLGRVAAEQDIDSMDREEALLLEYLEFSNRQKQLASFRLRVLKAWVNMLLVMFESNEFRGSAKTSFLLQSLQAILPSLECYASESPDEAFELAKVAKLLLFKIDFAATASEDSGQRVGDLVSDKLFRLYQICLSAISKWAGNSELRAMYYSICYRYLSGIVEKGSGFLPSRQKIMKSIHVHGERLLNVLCDDAYGSDAHCQTAALILLNALVKVGSVEDDPYVVEGLNRLNFIGVLIDSLKSVLQEWLEVIHTNNDELELLWNAKLTLILSICQTREGAKYVLQANLFHYVEVSGLFSADPELEIDPTNTTALEKHYSLLVRVARIIGAAVLARGPQSNVTQGPARRFLVEHRMLIVQVLKRSAGIGGRNASLLLEESVEDLAEALMVLITATGFLEFEEEMHVPSNTQPRATAIVFH